jgi:hypothetical protein
MELQELDHITLRFRSFCPLEEYQEAQHLFELVRALQETGQSDTNDPETIWIRYTLSFAKKMTEGSRVVSSEPDNEVFMDFKSTAAEYAAAFRSLTLGAEFYSRIPSGQDIDADKAILNSLFTNRLKDALLVPGIEVLLETDAAIYLKDLNNGKISITDAAEYVSQYYYKSGCIYYADAENKWAEIVHQHGLFHRFAPIRDEDVQRIIDSLNLKS